MKFLFFWLCCFSFFVISSNNSIAQNGLLLQILHTTPDARYAGMGDAGTAVADDIYAICRNPGGLGFLKKGQLKNTPYFEVTESSSFLPLYSNNDKSFLYTAGGAYIESIKGFLAGDLCYSSYGEKTMTATTGQTIGKYLSNEFYIGIAYGTSIGDDWGIGAKAKYFSSNLAPALQFSRESVDGLGFAFDIGVLWNPELDIDTNSILNKKSFSVGLSLLNLGPSIEYRNESEPLPTTLRCGVAMKLNVLNNRKLVLSIDGIKYLIKRDSLSSDPLPKSLISSWDSPLNFCFGFGGEFWVDKHFALRTGYYLEPEDAGNRNFMTFGASARIWIIQADVSYNNSTSLNKYLTNVLKLTFRVGC